MNSPLRNLLVSIPAVVSSYALYKYKTRFAAKFLPTLDWFARRVEASEIDPSQRAVVFSPTVNPPIALVFESLIAAKLRERGYDASVLMDSGHYGFPDSVSTDEMLSNRDYRRMVKYSAKELAGRAHYRFTHEIPGLAEASRVRQIAAGMMQSGDYMMDGIDLWPSIESSLVRYTKSALGFWSDQPAASRMKEKFTRNAIWSLMIAKGLKRELNPSLVVSSHGIYSTWGPFYQYLRREGVKVVIYDFGWYKPDGMIFTHSGLVANGSDDGFFTARRHQLPDKEAKAFVDDFMAKRLNGISFDIKKAQPTSTTEFSLDALLGKLQGRKVFALFPNVLWDASNADTDAYFANWVDWIIESVRYFSRSSDKALIIRAHPSEKDFMKARVTVEDILTRVFKCRVEDIPNITFIPPNADFRSYELFPHIRGGLVYNGTLGLEMIYKGIPVYVAGKAPYQEHDFVARFRDKDDYFAALDNPELILEQQLPHHDLLVKYLYTYFWVNQANIRFMNYFWRLPEAKILDEVWNDPQLNFAMDTAIGKHRFFQDWVLPVDARD